MHQKLIRRHKWLNFFHSTLLLVGMAGLFALLGWLLAGPQLMLWLMVFAVASFMFAPRLSPRMVLSLYGARQLTVLDAPQLHEINRLLSLRAGLNQAPSLYYIPSRMMNALSVGHGDQAVIALTDGLLRHMRLREMAGVIGHEMSHIKNNDVWVMALADFVSRMTNILSLLGQFLLILAIPLAVMTDVTISWVGVMLLVFAPMVSALMQMALSRTREFDADLDAARLTGDPQALASALAKLEFQSSSFLQRLLRPSSQSEPSVLRSHPQTEQRIERLMALAQSPHFDHHTHAMQLPDHYPMIQRRPGRRHILGLFH